MDRPIIITGFMAAGKTTVARALGKLLGCTAVDLDDVITETEKRTPKQIIDQDGEAAFREVETRSLRQALSREPNQVMALGGGAWTLQRNRDLIREFGGFTVWLDAPFELCWQRIAEAKSDRPLAPNRERAQSLYDERRAIYALSSLRLNADGDTDVDCLAAIIAGEV